MQLRPQRRAEERLQATHVAGAKQSKPEHLLKFSALNKEAKKHAVTRHIGSVFARFHTIARDFLSHLRVLASSAPAGGCQGALMPAALNETRQAKA